MPSIIFTSRNFPLCLIWYHLCAWWWWRLSFISLPFVSLISLLHLNVSLVVFLLFLLLLLLLLLLRLLLLLLLLLLRLLLLLLFFSFNKCFVCFRPIGCDFKISYWKFSFRLILTEASKMRKHSNRKNDVTNGKFYCSTVSLETMRHFCYRFWLFSVFHCSMFATEGIFCPNNIYSR